MPTLMLDGETTNNGIGPVIRSPLGVRVYSASIAGTGHVGATVTIQGSNDGGSWVAIGSIALSGTTSASGSTRINDTNTMTRAVITGLVGIGAAVTAVMEQASVPSELPRVVALVDAATVTPNADTTDHGNLLTVAQNITVANPTGTPADGQILKLRVKSAAVKTVTFGDKFRATATALPTATAGSGQTERWVFEWNAADSKWDILSTNAGA